MSSLLLPFATCLRARREVFGGENGSKKQQNASPQNHLERSGGDGPDLHNPELSFLEEAGAGVEGSIDGRSSPPNERFHLRQNTHTHTHTGAVQATTIFV